MIDFERGSDDFKNRHRSELGKIVFKIFGKPASPPRVGAWEDSFQDFRRIPEIYEKFTSPFKIDT